jgi:hypothetical protein
MYEAQASSTRHYICAYIWFNIRRKHAAIGRPLAKYLSEAPVIRLRILLGMNINKL